MNAAAPPPTSSAAKSTTSPDALECLSALADGRAEHLDRACLAWRESAEAQVAWHRWHLIGDSLRSEELASRPERDEAFLQRLRERLAQEPVVLAPSALPRRARDDGLGVPAFGGSMAGQGLLRRWGTPAAVAAGFAAVAVSAVVLRGPAPGSGAELARAQGPSQTVSLGQTSAAAGSAAPPLVLVNEQMLRDTQLDRYLQAHRQGAGTLPAAVPGGPTRRIENVSLSR